MILVATQRNTAMLSSSSTRNFTTTRHAAERIAQRGVRLDALEIVLAYGDDIPAAGDCRRREFRHCRMGEALADNVPLSVLEAALKIEAVVSSKDQLVTCYLRTPRNLTRSKNKQRRQDRRGRRL